MRNGTKLATVEDILVRDLSLSRTQAGDIAQASERALEGIAVDGSVRAFGYVTDGGSDVFLADRSDRVICELRVPASAILVDAVG